MCIKLWRRQIGCDYWYCWLADWEIVRFEPEGQAYFPSEFPPCFRAFAYFCIRYFLKLGFLDGYPGWMWHVWQGLWYRWLVDREILRMKK